MKKLALLSSFIILTSCGGGGGGALVNNTPSTPSTPTQPYQTIDSIEYNYDTSHGEINVTYGSGSYLDDSNFSKTDKYKIADYGFFQITTVGRHDGTSRNPQEVQDAGPFSVAGVVHRADLNGDGHEDFFYEGFFEGDRESMPNSYLHAFINDGNGHFVYSPDIFAGGISPCINYGDLDFKTDPYNDCGYVRHLQRGLVGDFNGDGIDDFFKPSILHLSNDGVIENKGQTNLPSWMFAIDDDPNTKNGAYSHDIIAGDIDNDGDLDIFGAWTHNDENTNHSMGVIINDGTGNFTTTNWNFYQMPMPYEIGADHILWNTTAAIGDFDNDGYMDVSVGWANPTEAKIYGFGDTYEFSAGAVFWNDGNMDWSKLWTELPDNYYGANGLANDMETIDINNDGYLDIVLASTKVDPYYDGRAVQFFLNNGDGTFSDATSTYHPDIGDYADGSGSWWNGEGSLHILDFDNDGDLDIVDSVNGTYVLVNNNGSFSIYNNFPDQGECGGCRYFPVEIDGKWQYDFIGYTWEAEYDTHTATFFQVLDPPLMQMMEDITTKPAGYVKTVFESKTLLNDLRLSTRGDNTFYKRQDGSNMLGASYGNFYVADLSGDIEGGLIGFDFIANFGNQDNIHVGYYYADTTIKAQNKTIWYGTGTAELNVKSYNGFIEYIKPWSKNFWSSVGYTLHHGRIDGFTENDSAFNVKIDGFTMWDSSVFVDINYVLQSKLGTTFVSIGVDHYMLIDDVHINFADGLKYAFNEDITLGNFSLTHQWKQFYFRAKADSKDRSIVELGLNLEF